MRWYVARILSYFGAHLFDGAAAPFPHLSAEPPLRVWCDIVILSILE
jgi:hypothetical protein